MGQSTSHECPKTLAANLGIEPITNRALTSPGGEFSKSQTKICDKGDIATNKLLKQTHFSGDWLLNIAVKIVVWHISYRSSITVSLAPSGPSQQFSCVPHVIGKIHENPILPIFNFLPMQTHFKPGRELQPCSNHNKKEQQFLQQVAKAGKSDDLLSMQNSPTEYFHLLEKFCETNVRGRPSEARLDREGQEFIV